MNHLGIINYLSPEGGGDWILAGIIRFLGGRRRDQSPATEYKEGTNEKCLPIGGGNTRILKSPRSGGGGREGFKRGILWRHNQNPTTQSTSLSHSQATNNDRSLTVGV